MGVFGLNSALVIGVFWKFRILVQISHWYNLQISVIFIFTGNAVFLSSGFFGSNSGKGVLLSSGFFGNIPVVSGHYQEPPPS